MKICKLFVAISVAIWASACVTVPEVAYDRSTAAVQTIVLVEPGFPVKTQAPDAGNTAASAGSALGLVGALVGAAIEASAMSNRENTLEKIVTEKQFDARESFKQELSAALKAEGYRVIYLSSTEPDRTQHLPELPSVADDADAILDVVVTSYGYLTTGKEWRPHLHSKIILTRVGDNSVLMQNLVNYNDLLVQGTQISISPSPEYAFSDIENMEADADTVVAGLQEAVTKSVNAIVTLLK